MKKENQLGQEDDLSLIHYPQYVLIGINSNRSRACGYVDKAILES